MLGGRRRCTCAARFEGTTSEGRRQARWRLDWARRLESDTKSRRNEHGETTTKAPHIKNEETEKKKKMTRGKSCGRTDEAVDRID